MGYFLLSLNNFIFSIVSYKALKLCLSLTTLTNVLNHQITLNEKTVPSIFFAIYIFNLSSDLQYTDIELKELFIDLNTSTQLIGSISQLKALQQLDTSVQLDKTTTRLVNFIFGIDSTSSIKSVNLGTPLRSIIF